ncbi:serine/arginine repetitive matrix protein 1 isoform X2, partial [Biomphalaria glabrata]
HFQHSSHLGMDNKLPERWSSTESKAAIKPERDNSDYYSYDADHNRASLSPPNKSEVGSSTDDESHYHPHLDIPPPTVQVDVVGLGSDEEEAYVDGNTGNRHVEYRGAEDSGVVLDLSRSLDVAASSPCREQCWTKPQFTSTPLWRPWSQFRKAENEDTGVQESPLIQSLSSEDQGLHFNSQQTLSKNIEAPLDLRVNQPIPTQIAANNYSYVLSPMPYALQHPALALNYPQIQLASTLPATENSQSSLPSHYQCQVPQVTTTCSTKGKGKRPSSTTCMQVSAKQARCNSSPKSPTRAPLTEFPQKLIRQTRNIHGVMLAMPPENALPSRAALKGKRKCTKEDDQGTSSKCSENSRKRDRPQPYGDHELHEFVVQFYDSPLRSKYCDENNKYQVPRVPDNREDQAILRSELLELFQHSNLPGVPSALQYNVHALCFYPKMQHLFSLHQDGVDLEVLHFGAYGQAFGNLNLAAMSDDELNTILDSMSYVGDDGLMHCLVIRTVDNGVVCDHVATELGKMRRHSKNHYPEKKWVCCFCRAQMPDMTDMERHTSTHTGLKPFRCIECNKFFAQKITLGHHLKSVHNLVMTKMDPKKTFTCRQDGCLFQEHEREACLLHLEQHHSQEDFRNRKKRKQWPYDL